MTVGRKAGQGQYGRVGKEARQEKILEIIGLDDLVMQISSCNCQITSVQRISCVSWKQLLGVNGNERGQGFGSRVDTESIAILTDAQNQ